MGAPHATTPSFRRTDCLPVPRAGARYSAAFEVQPATAVTKSQRRFLTSTLKRVLSPTGLKSREARTSFLHTPPRITHTPTTQQCRAPSLNPVAVQQGVWPVRKADVQAQEPRSPRAEARLGERKGVNSEEAEMVLHSTGRCGHHEGTGSVFHREGAPVDGMCYFVSTSTGDT